MDAPFIPPEAQYLTEKTSINILQKIESESILTPLSSQPITTTFIHQGKGEIPLLLLHGFDSSVLEFRRLLPLLQEKQETWAVDLLGFGFTERREDISFDAVSIKTHLYAFWENLINQPVIIVGTSMGGATALDFALSYPHAVEKLVLIDSAGLANPPIIGKFMFPPLDGWATEFLKNSFIRQNISRAAYYDKTLASKDAQYCAALHLKCSGWNRGLISFSKSGGYGSFAEQLPQIKQPTLILWGKNDGILGTKDAIKFEKLILDSKLIWLENCGHVPHLEQPQITAEHILNWV